MNNEEKILQALEELKSDMAEAKEKLEEVDQRSIRTQVLLETDYADKLQLLLDGHKTILETLAPKSRVEALEDDVALLKSVIKSMSQRLNDLEKAQ